MVVLIRIKHWKLGAGTFVFLFLSVTLILHSFLVFESDYRNSAALRGDGHYLEEGFGTPSALGRKNTTVLESPTTRNITIIRSTTQELEVSRSLSESEEGAISSSISEEEYASTSEPEPLETCVVPPHMKSNSTNSETSKREDDSASCAILFFGLPRSYKLFVLPSIIENIIIPNMDNNCDYFIHYHSVTSEEGIRFAERGGEIHGKDVFLLEEAIRQTYQREATDVTRKNIPYVSVTNSTIEEFETARNQTLHLYETTLDEDGEYLYFPVESASWQYPHTMRNMIKQWHSIDAVWRHMEKNARLLQKNYSRVAMFRNDVVYVTPIDVYQLSSQKRDVENNHFMIPDWANHPINDRMVVGPYDAVKIWATERFQRAEDHIRNYPIPGWGLHSERFLNFTIVPAMLDAPKHSSASGYVMDQNPDICFLRARADGSVWLQDCDESFECDMEPIVRQLLAKYHTMATSSNHVGVFCEINYLDGIKNQDILSCSENTTISETEKEIG